MHWLNSKDKKSLSSIDNPMVLLKFVNAKHTILHDTHLHAEVDVEINKGIPYCKNCKEDDCAHVGFVICVEQLYGHLSLSPQSLGLRNQVKTMVWNRERRADHQMIVMEPIIAVPY